MESIRASWQEPTIDKGLESFPGFCELVGVSKALDYLRSRQAQDVKDWSSYILDEEGRVIQTEMARSFQVLAVCLTNMLQGTLKICTVSPAQGDKKLPWSFGRSSREGFGRV